MVGVLVGLLAACLGQISAVCCVLSLNDQYVVTSHGEAVLITAPHLEPLLHSLIPITFKVQQ